MVFFLHSIYTIFKTKSLFNILYLLLSSILILNIIKFIMVLLLIIFLCSYYLINMGIELKWLIRFNLMSESLRSKIVNIINYVLKILETT